MGLRTYLPTSALGRCRLQLASSAGPRKVAAGPVEGQSPRAAAFAVVNSRGARPGAQDVESEGHRKVRRVEVFFGRNRGVRGGGLRAEPGDAWSSGSRAFGRLGGGPLNRCRSLLKISPQGVTAKATGLVIVPSTVSLMLRCSY